MFPLGQLATVDGRAVEVIDTGLQNTDAGPDFFNAKVKIGGTVWVGNVELHDKSSAWTAHGHDRDHAYDNVVLHVATEIDADVATAGGRVVPQMRLEVPQAVSANYEALLSIDRYPPCFAVIPRLDRLTVHGWMSRLVAERLELKTEAIMRRVELCGGSWESALFVTMARNYGFGVNGDAFERWALGIPLQADPTIKYAMQDFGLRRILYRHLKYESPYNTYLHRGLPPSPICMPSIAAIDAVLDYEQNDYIYFCARPTFDGYHNFARTLAEHNANARAYQRELNKRKIK